MTTGTAQSIWTDLRKVHTQAKSTSSASFVLDGSVIYVAQCKRAKPKLLDKRSRIKLVLQSNKHRNSKLRPMHAREAPPEFTICR